jgi:DNA-binding response OmpR family regulator
MAILVAEDDRESNKNICFALYNARYTAVPAYTAAEALKELQTKKYDLVIMDRIFENENIDGLEIMQKIKKEQKENSPWFLMLTKRNLLVDKVKGLNDGADDYLSKPFYIEEMLARTKALLRRKEKVRSAGKINAGLLVFDLDSFEVRFGGKIVKVSGKELQLLELLIKRKGKIVLQEDLSNIIWQKSESDFSSNTIAVHIRRLREKLNKAGGEKSLIKTIRGVGYKLISQDQD